PLADSYGYRAALLVCLLTVATSSLATALAVDMPVLVLAAVLGAVGRAAVMPVAQAIVAICYAGDTPRRRAISRIQSGSPLAATLGIPLLTVIAAALQWRGAFVVVSGLALAIALVLWAIFRQDEATAGDGQVRLKSI